MKSSDQRGNQEITNQWYLESVPANLTF